MNISAGDRQNDDDDDEPSSMVDSREQESKAKLGSAFSGSTVGAQHFSELIEGQLKFKLGCSYQRGKSTNHLTEKGFTPFILEYCKKQELADLSTITLAKWQVMQLWLFGFVLFQYLHRSLSEFSFFRVEPSPFG